MRDSREKGAGIRDQDPLATARKIIDAACSIQAGRFFRGRNYQCQIHESSPAFGGNRAYPNFKLCNPITLYLLNRSYPYYRHDLPILKFVSTDSLTLSLFANSGWFDVLSRSRPSASLVTRPFIASNRLPAY